VADEKIIQTFKIDEDVFQIIEKNHKYIVSLNKKKISEFSEIGKAVKKFDELTEPLSKEWHKKHNIKESKDTS